MIKRSWFRISASLQTHWKEDTEWAFQGGYSRPSVKVIPCGVHISSSLESSTARKSTKLRRTDTKGGLTHDVLWADIRALDCGSSSKVKADDFVP